MSSMIETPENRKTKKQGTPYHKIKILQKLAGDAILTVVKDFDLKAKYIEDSVFKKICEINHYNFNGNTGMTCKVAQL